MADHNKLNDRIHEMQERNRRDRRRTTALGVAVLLLVAAALVLPALSATRDSATTDAGFFFAGSIEQDENGDDVAQTEAGVEARESADPSGNQGSAEADADAEAPEDADEEAAQEALERPAQRLVQRIAGDAFTVAVDAPQGALPAGTTMRANRVEDADVVAAALKEAADSAEVDAATANVMAVDIAFLDADGEEVQPAKSVRVTFSASDVLDIASASDLAIVHVDDELNADALPADDVTLRQKREEVAFEASEFSVYAVVYQAESPARAAAKAAAANLTAVQGTTADAAQADPNYPEDGYDITGWVTDATIETTDGQDVEKDGNVYIIKDNQYYTIKLSLKTGNYDDATYEDNHELLRPLLYPIPDGVDIQDLSKTFSLKVGRYTITGNTMTTVTGPDGKRYIRLDLNSDSRYYKQLLEATDNELEIDMTGTFTGTTNKIGFGGTGDSGTIEIRKDDSHNAKVAKTGYYDAGSGKVYYTVTVTGDKGTSANVRVTDVLAGAALTLDSASVQVAKNGGNPGWGSFTDNSTADGIDLTINEVKEGEAYTVTYAATVDIAKIAKSGNATFDEMGNTVTINAPGDEDTTDNTATHVERNVNFSTFSKVSTGTSDIVEEDGKKYRIVTWKVTSNPERSVSLAGSTITDANLSGDRMDYYGEGISVSVDGGAPTDVPWSQVGVDDPATAGSWTYAIAQEGNHSYEITYQTRVDVTGLTQPVEVGNRATGKQGDDGQKVTVNPATSTEKASTVHKTVASINEETITWKIAVDVPAGYSGPLKVEDLLPNLNQSQIFDTLESYAIMGLQPGESYEVEHETKDYSWWENGQQYTKNVEYGVVFTFTHDEGGTTAEGLKPSDSNRTITIEVVTRNDEEWVKSASSEKWKADHTNSANVVGGDEVTGSDSAKTQVNEKGLKKSDGARNDASFWVESGKYYDEAQTQPILESYTLPAYRFEVTFEGVTSDSITFDDYFDTELFEILDGTQGSSISPVITVEGGDWPTNFPAVDKYTSLADAQGKVSIASGDGKATIRLTDLPKTSDGEPWGYYRFSYYLIVKDRATLEKLQSYVSEHGTPIGEGGDVTGKRATFVNTATWEGLAANGTYDYDIDKVIDKTGAYDEASDTYRYTITVNPDELAINGGAHFDMEDFFQGVEVSTDLSVSDVHITEWDESGNEYDDDFIEVDSVDMLPDEEYIESHIGKLLREDPDYADHVLSDKHEIDAETVFLYVNPTTHLVTAEIPDKTKIVITYTATPTHEVTIDPESGTAKEIVTNTANVLDYHKTVDLERSFEFLKKEKGAGEDGAVPFTIDFNDKKMKLNGGADITLTDTVAGDIAIDEASFKVVADPAKDASGADIAAKVLASMVAPQASEGEGEGGGSGSATRTYAFTIPDGVHVTITYSGTPSYSPVEGTEEIGGVLRSSFANTATALGVSKTVDGGDETVRISKGHGDLIDDPESPYDGEIPFTIVFNPQKDELNEGRDITLTDSFENLVLNYGSIAVECDPQADAVYDFSGNVGTFTVPDRTKVTITYTAKPDYGKATSVTWKNVAEACGYKTSDSSSSTSSGDVSGGGTQNRQMYLLKYQTGNMAVTLPGVTFRLFKMVDVDAGGQAVVEPVVYGAGATAGMPGEQVTYTTEESATVMNPYGAGYVRIVLNQDYGKNMRLEMNQIYFLQEVEAPEGYEYDDTMYVFVFADDDFEWPANYMGYKMTIGVGEVMKVRNTALVDSVTVSKQWFSASGSTAWPAGYEVDVQLYREDAAGERAAVSDVPQYYANLVADYAAMSEAEKAQLTDARLAEIEAAQRIVDAGGEAFGKVTLAEGASRATWEHLDEPAEGEKYAVAEVAVRKDGQVLSSEELSRFDVTTSDVVRGVATIRNVERTSVEVEKKWSVGDSLEWPEDVASVQVGLFAGESADAGDGDGDGEQVATATISKPADGAAATAAFSNLPQLDSGGNKISYSVRELSLTKSDGTVVYPDSAGKIDGFRVTNGAVENGKAEIVNRKAAPMQIVVKKTFGEWPADMAKSDKAALMAAISFTVSGPDGFTPVTRTLAADDGFAFDAATGTYTWVLSVEEEGKYTVTEQNADIAGYRRTTEAKLNGAAVSGADTGGAAGAAAGVSLVAEPGENLVEFENAYTQQTGIDVTVNKVWKDASGNDITTAMPDDAYVTVALKREGGASEDKGDDGPSYSINLRGGWDEASSSDERQLATATPGSLVTLTISETVIDHGSWLDRYTLDPSIGYNISTWETKSVEKTTKNLDGNVKAVTFVMPERDVYVWTSKDSSSTNAIAGCIDVTVSVPSNAETVATATLSNAEGWSHVFADLPKADEADNAYTYSVAEVESSVPGYTVSYGTNKIVGADGTVTVTNTARSTSSKDFTIKKSWLTQDTTPTDAKGRTVTFDLYRVKDSASGDGSGTVTFRVPSTTVKGFKIESQDIEAEQGGTVDFSFTIDFSKDGNKSDFIDRIENRNGKQQNGVKIDVEYMSGDSSSNFNGSAIASKAVYPPRYSIDETNDNIVTVTFSLPMDVENAKGVKITNIYLEDAGTVTSATVTPSGGTTSDVDWTVRTTQDAMAELAADASATKCGTYTLTYDDMAGGEHWAKLFSGLESGYTYFAVETAVDGDTALSAQNYNPQYAYSVDARTETITNTLPPSCDLIVQKRFMYDSNDKWHADYGSGDNDIKAVRFVLLKRVAEGTEGAKPLVDEVNVLGQKVYGYYVKVVTGDADSNGVYTLTPSSTVEGVVTQADAVVGGVEVPAGTHTVNWAMMFTGLPGAKGDYRFEECSADGSVIFDSREDTSCYMTCDEYENQVTALKNDLVDVRGAKHWDDPADGDAYYHPAVTMRLYRLTVSSNDAEAQDSADVPQSAEAARAAGYVDMTPVYGTKKLAAGSSADEQGNDPYVEWAELPKMDIRTGKLYRYLVLEDGAVPGYRFDRVQQVGKWNDADYTLTNTMDKIDLYVKKQWQDASGAVVEGEALDGMPSISYKVMRVAYADEARTEAKPGTSAIDMTPEGKGTLPEEDDGGAKRWYAVVSGLPSASVGADGTVVYYSYYVVETAPAGYVAYYQADGGDVEVSPADAVISMEDAKYGTTIVNKRVEFSIGLEKVDGSDEPLSGAGFVLERYEDIGFKNKLDATDELKVGADGTLKFEGLSAGFYKLVETTVPAGYVVTSNDPRFKVEMAIDQETKQPVFSVVPLNSVDTVTYSQLGDTTTVRVKNIAGEQLPTTGGIGTVPFVVGGIALIALAALLLFRARRK